MMILIHQDPVNKFKWELVAEYLTEGHVNVYKELIEDPANLLNEPTEAVDNLVNKLEGFAAQERDYQYAQRSIMAQIRDYLFSGQRLSPPRLYCTLIIDSMAHNYKDKFIINRGVKNGFMHALVGYKLQL